MASHRPPGLPPFPVWKGLFGSVSCRGRRCLSCTRGGRPSLQRCIRPSRLFSRRFRPVLFFSLSLWQPRIFPKSGGSWHCFLGDDSAPVLNLKIFGALNEDFPDDFRLSRSQQNFSKRARPCEIPLHIPSGSRLPHFAVLFSAFPDGAILKAFFSPFLEEVRVDCFMDQPPLLFPSGFKNCCMQTSLRYSVFCIQFSSAIFFSLVSSFWCTPPFVEHTLEFAYM